MSDGYDKLDELFRNKFEKVELPVSDNLLANIKKELNLPQKHKRRFGYWIWLLAVLSFFVTITGAYYYFFNKEKTDYATNTVMDVSDSKTFKTQPNKVDVSNNVNGAVNGKFKNKIVENVDTVGLSENKMEGSTPANQSENNTSVETNATSTKHSSFITKEEKSIANEKEGKPTVPHNTRAKQRLPKTTLAPLLVEKNKKENINTSKLSGVKALSDKRSVIHGQASEENELTTEQQPEKNKTTIIEKIVAAEADKKTLSKVDTTLQYLADTTTSKTDTIIATNSEKIIDTAKQNNADKKVKENEASEKFNFFAEISGGASQSFRTLNPDNNLVLGRNASEKQYLLYNGGIDFGAVINNRYQISLGLGIDTKGEKFHYQGQDGIFNTWTTDSIVYDTTIIDTTVVIDTSWVLVPHTEQLLAAVAEKSGHNKYQYFKLPLMFGYRFNVKEKWFVTPNVGLVLNYLITAQSTWFDPEKQQYITYSNRNMYSPILIAARAKIDIGFNLNDKWSLLVQPGYTRFLQSIYRKDERFKQYPYSYDVNIAVRYRF